MGAGGLADDSFAKGEMTGREWGTARICRASHMHLGTPITPVTRRSVSGSVTMFLNPSLQTKSTDDCAAGRIDRQKLGAIGLCWGQPETRR